MKLESGVWLCWNEVREVYTWKATENRRHIQTTHSIPNPNTFILFNPGPRAVKLLLRRK